MTLLGRRVPSTDRCLCAFPARALLHSPLVMPHRLCDFGCGADMVQVDLNRELGLDEVAPMVILKGTGERVVKLIQNAWSTRRP